MDLKEEDILGADIGRHWYYRSKAAALRKMAVVPLRKDGEEEKSGDPASPPKERGEKGK